jgi:hypothetical protein
MLPAAHMYLVVSHWVSSNGASPRFLSERKIHHVEEEGTSLLAPARLSQAPKSVMKFLEDLTNTSKTMRATMVEYQTIMLTKPPT